jgi:hypothetical protein
LVSRYANLESKNAALQSKLAAAGGGAEDLHLEIAALRQELKDAQESSNSDIRACRLLPSWLAYLDLCRCAPCRCAPYGRSTRRNQACSFLVPPPPEPHFPFCTNAGFPSLGTPPVQCSTSGVTCPCTLFLGEERGIEELQSFVMSWCTSSHAEAGCRVYTFQLFWKHSWQMHTRNTMSWIRRAEVSATR